MFDHAPKEHRTRSSIVGGLAPRDVSWAAIGAALVGVAFVVPHLDLGGFAPLLHSTRAQIEGLANTAPLLARWLPHVGWGTPFAIGIAIAVIWVGPRLSSKVSWTLLVPMAWGVSALWAMSLALIDGFEQGFGYRLTNPTEYLPAVGAVRGIGGFLDAYAAHAAMTGPGGSNLQVAGHPPGAILTFVALNRIGLSSKEWASALCVVVGASAAAAILVATKALVGEALARRAAPFLVIAPTAIWIAVSADGYFAGVAAWGLALLAVASRRRDARGDLTAAAAGLLLGFGVYLSYGLVLMALPVLGVFYVSKNWRVMIPALVGAVVVAVVFTVGGFWWFDGYQAVQHRYWAGIARNRPFAYWVWGDLAALACAVGLAVCAALPRALNWTKIRERAGLHVLVSSFVVAVVLADLSGLSKAETERIWLPFAVWLSAAPALLPARSHRLWLGVQATGALLISSLLLTNW